MKSSLNLYSLLEEIVSSNCIGGYYKFYKHRSDEPSLTDAELDQLREQITHYVMLGICEHFDFD